MTLLEPWEIAYWSDRSGEYELYTRPADGTGAERKLTDVWGYDAEATISPRGDRIAVVTGDDLSDERGRPLG